MSDYDVYLPFLGKLVKIELRYTRKVFFGRIGAIGNTALRLENILKGANQFNDNDMLYPTYDINIDLSEQIDKAKSSRPFVYDRIWDFKHMLSKEEMTVFLKDLGLPNIEEEK